MVPTWYFDQRRHCNQDSQQPSNKKLLRKRIVMSIISPDSLVVAVKLGHMLVICRSKSSLCLDLLNEIEYTYTWTNDPAMLLGMNGNLEILKCVSFYHDLLKHLPTTRGIYKNSEGMNGII